MKKIVIGSHNLSKISEFKEIFSKTSITLVTPQELNIEQIPEEIGNTFAENSLLKAKFYANLSGLPALADDGGLEIPILQNYPGVKTRRWDTDKILSDMELVEKIFLKLSTYKGQDRKAFLKTVITVYNPTSGSFIQKEGFIEGEITNTLTEKIENGYPIRSIFYIPKAGKLYSQFNKRDREKYNHRKQILKEMLKDINSLI